MIFTKQKFIATIGALLFALFTISVIYQGGTNIDIVPLNCNVEILEAPDVDVSYPNNSAYIQITRKDIPFIWHSGIINLKSNATGKLVIKIKGMAPSYNNYRYFKVNGDEIATAKNLQKIWEKQPVSYSVDVKNGENVKIEYQYENGFVLGISNLLKIVLLYLLIFALIFYILLKTSWIKCEKILEKNWLDEIRNFYTGINPVYRNSFWILFIITNIVFGFHTINFFWGNHDWPIMIEGAPFTHSLWEGRYSAFAISEFLTGNMYLPIISAFWAFAASSLSAILLAVYWKLPQKTSYFVIFGLILNITPYTCAWLYFGHWIVNIFSARCMIFAGFVLSDKLTFSKTLSTKIKYMLSAILLMNLGLSVNASFINSFILALSGRVIVEMIDWPSFIKGIENSFKQNIFAVINAIIAIATFKIIFEYLKYEGIIHSGRYNLETTPLAEMPEKIILCVKSAWQQFTNWSMPFYPDVLTKLFLILAVIFLIQILLSRREWAVKIFICVALFASLFLTKSAAVVSQGEYAIYLARVDFCGYVLFNALLVALCLKSGGILQNIKILISCAIIYLFAINCLWQQRTFKLGFDSEVMIYDRMQARLENNPDFDAKKKYIILRLGGDVSMREAFYPMTIHNYKDGTMLTGSFNNTWQSLVVPIFYNPGYVKKTLRPNYFSHIVFMSNLRRIFDAGLLENAQAWPAKNSIIVYEDIILVVMDENSLNKAKFLLNEQVKKEQAVDIRQEKELSND